MSGTALLVVDVQTGAFDGKLISAIHDGGTLLQRISALIDAARAADVPIIYIQHCAAEGPLARGTPGWDIHTAVAPLDGERIIEKQESNAFDGTNLERELIERGISSLIVCGLQSERCVTNTSLGALEHDINVMLAEDAHSTWPTEAASAQETIARQNELLRERGATVQITAEIIAKLTA